MPWAKKETGGCRGDVGHDWATRAGVLPPPVAERVREGAHGLSANMTRQIPAKPRWQVTGRMRKHAWALRTDMMLAERIAWRAVRAHRLNGVGFRRQAPIGPYIVDFVSYAAMLVIEIDGGQHFEDSHERRDAIRDRYLKRLGFRVVRFNDYDVMTNRNAHRHRCGAGRSRSPLPTLPRKRGRRRDRAVGEKRNGRLLLRCTARLGNPRRRVPSPACGGGIGRGPAAYPRGAGARQGWLAIFAGMRD